MDPSTQENPVVEGCQLLRSRRVYSSMEDVCQLIKLVVFKKTLKVMIFKIGETAVPLNRHKLPPLRP